MSTLPYWRAFLAFILDPLSQNRLQPGTASAAKRLAARGGVCWQCRIAHRAFMAHLFRRCQSGTRGHLRTKRTSESTVLSPAHSSSPPASICKIKATINKGVLKVVMEKPAAKETKKIEVKAAA
jgi:hypothetical protein